MRRISSQELKSIIYDLGEQKSVITEAEILATGASKGQIEKMVKSGVLYPSAQGIYMPENADFTEQHTRVEVAARFPEAVICLDTALNFHRLTTQMPNQVRIAVKTGCSLPREPKLPIKTVDMSEPGLSQGIEIHVLEGIPVKIYSIAKTVADCFIYQQEVGIDVAIEAFEQAIEERRCTVEQIVEYTKNRSMRGDIRPYFEGCVNKALRIPA